MVARDGVEPPTPAFSGLYSLSLNPFSINNLIHQGGPFIVTTSADVRLSVGWRNDELKICIVCLSFPHAILLVADLLHPVDHLAVFLFLNGDVGHGCGSRG